MPLSVVLWSRAGVSANHSAPAFSATERTRAAKAREDSQQLVVMLVSRNALSKKQPVAFSTQEELASGEYPHNPRAFLRASKQGYDTILQYIALTV